MKAYQKSRLFKIIYIVTLVLLIVSWSLGMAYYPTLWRFTTFIGVLVAWSLLYLLVAYQSLKCPNCGEHNRLLVPDERKSSLTFYCKSCGKMY